MKNEKSQNQYKHVRLKKNNYTALFKITLKNYLNVSQNTEEFIEEVIILGLSVHSGGYTFILTTNDDFL